MTDEAQWQAGNDKYLSAALSWLRLRLERLSPAESAHTQLFVQEYKPSPIEPVAPSFLDRFLKRPTAEPPPDVRALPPAGPVASNDRQIAQAAADVSAAEAMDPSPALHILGERLGLSRFERQVLLLCAAIELDTRIASLCARAQGDPARTYPTFALALALFDEPAWDVLSPERPLRYWRLIEINQTGAQPLTASPLRADERIVNYLKGLNYLDDRLALFVTALDMEPINLPPSQQGVADAIVQHVKLAAQMQTALPVIQLAGLDTSSKRLVAWHAAALLGLHLYRLPAGLLPAQATELDTLARLWQRESSLLPVALYLDAHELDGSSPAEGQAPPIGRFLTRCSAPVFLNVREAWPNLERAAVMFDIATPAPAEQRAAWDEALGPGHTQEVSALAGQFNLGVSDIYSISRSAALEPSKNGQSTLDEAWQACLLHTRPQLDVLAQRLEPKATWDDMVLAETELRVLRQIAGQVSQRSKVYDEWGFRSKMNRGLGISALFAGESGTGKTMAAEVIANDLRLNLYRIDLSAVVSKYIGETEKNLRRLFDAAEDGGAILFFDEADALFGKRSEVKDSHDRYANIEINYLLQRMEVYRGLAILATNMKSALDTAFMRRLRFTVNFAFPGPAERKLIWLKVFPPETPTANLDFERLARHNLTGGSIHNIAVNAAFLAAQAGTPVTMPLVLDAARAEFRKMERTINEADFR